MRVACRGDARNAESEFGHGDDDGGPHSEGAVVLRLFETFALRDYRKYVALFVAHGNDNSFMKPRNIVFSFGLYIAALGVALWIRYPSVLGESVLHSYLSTSERELLFLLDIVTFGSVSAVIGGVHIAFVRYLQNRIISFLDSNNDWFDTVCAMFSSPGRCLLDYAAALR